MTHLLAAMFQGHLIRVAKKWSFPEQRHPLSTVSLSPHCDCTFLSVCAVEPGEERESVSYSNNQRLWSIRGSGGDNIIQVWP